MPASDVVQLGDIVAACAREPTAAAGLGAAARRVAPPRRYPAAVVGGVSHRPTGWIRLQPVLRSLSGLACGHLANDAQTHVAGERLIRPSNRGRCVCSYQTRDTKGCSCKGRHELVQSKPQPICYLEQITPAMMSDWRRQRAK